MNMKKILVMGILIFCFFGTVNGDIRSEIRIDSMMWDPSYIEAGDDVTVYMKFVNRPIERTWAVQNPDNIAREENHEVFYKAKLEPADDLAEKYVIIKKDTKNVGHLFIGESWTTPFDIKIRDNAIATSYKMKFSVMETDIDGTDEEVVKFHEFDLPVRGMVKFDVDSDNTVRLGSISDVTVNVKNEGGGNAKHVMVKLDLTSPFTPVRTSELYVGDFMAGEDKDITFKVSVDSETEAMVYKIPLTIKYINANGSEKQVSKDIGVRIDATPDLTIGLESADTFTQGSKGEVSIEVVNEGFVDAKFVKLTLEPTDDYTVTSINEFYIGNLDSDDIETDEFTIEVSDSVDKETIPLKVKLQYKGDGSDAKYTHEGTVNLKVLSKEEYAAKFQADGASSMIFGLLMAVPVLFIVILVVWFIIKLLGLVTGFLNRKLFSK